MKTSFRRKPLIAALMALALSSVAGGALAAYQLQVPMLGAQAGGTTGGTTDGFLVLQIDSEMGAVTNDGFMNTCPIGAQSAPFLINGPGTPFDSTRNFMGAQYYEWKGPYYDPNTDTFDPATVCVPAKATDSLALASYTLPVYSSDYGSAMFSGWQVLSPQTVDGVMLRVTTSAGTYRIHALGVQYSKCADGSASCGSQDVGFVASRVRTVGATLESSGGADVDYSLQIPYMPYGATAMDGTATAADATGVATVTIPATAISTLQ